MKISSYNLIIQDKIDTLLEVKKWYYLPSDIDTPFDKLIKELENQKVK